jgi:hypothetical protein
VTDTKPKATHEREITAPVLLCQPGGRRLDEAAKGWSRTPLHTCNLRGVWGRTKRWDWWGILTGDLAIAITYADVDFLGLANVWWADLATGETGGHDVATPAGKGITLPDKPGTAPLTHRSKGLSLDLTDDEAGTHLRATWVEEDGRTGELDALVALPEGHESLNVVIPWSDKRFQYTSKHQARPVTGSARLGGRTHQLGDGGDKEAWGVLDVGRGRWPYSTNWNWGSGAGRSIEGTTIGIQIGGRWTSGTGFTENGIIVDGRLTKIGAELEWTYDWDHPLEPWTVVDPDGHLDLRLDPIYDKPTNTDAKVLSMKVHQAFGRWTGTVTADDGSTHHVDGIPGFAEECRARW